MAADSLRSSCITDANASGFTPLSHSFTQIAKVSESKPVLRSLDISVKAEIKILQMSKNCWFILV